mgnify:CR=1 FL=1|tara:strand:+ start:573 stop:851 length:279 start_codon:yes stop_codon:yes gene_type:complete
MSEKQNKEVPVEQQMAEQAVESATNAPAAEPQAPASDLSVQDLQGLKTIIDVASSRGAFKPNEMVQIGQLYNKLESFLGAIAAQQGQNPEGV